MEHINEQLRRFVEDIANSRSSNLHGFTGLPEEARKLTKLFGGRLDKISKMYEEGSASRRPHDVYVGDEWIAATLNRQTDTWEFPRIWVYVRTKRGNDPSRVLYITSRGPDLMGLTPQYAKHYKTKEEAEADIVEGDGTTVVYVSVVGRSPLK